MREVHVIRRLRRLGPLVVTLTIAALGAATAQAAHQSSSPSSGLLGGSCGATQSVFAAWGDPSQYYFTSNGGFESGASGWTLTGGAAVVDGNEPFHVHADSDSASLVLPAGATAVSPELCFGLLTPNVRFFAVASSKPATIHVRLIARGLLGPLTVLDGGTINVGTSWAPSPVLTTLVSQLNSVVGAKSVELEFSSSGEVRIDDIYIDPFVAH
jgi:hypothetical protein